MWELADQVHTDDLVRKYHQKHPLNKQKYKMMKKTWTKVTSLITPQTMTCLPPALLTSPLPLPQASLSTQQPSGHPCLVLLNPKPWCSIAKSPFTSWTRWWPFLNNSVCFVYPSELFALLLKGTTPTPPHCTRTGQSGAKE